MQYKGQLAPMGPEIVKKALGRQTPADVGEFLRKNFVRGMREGERLCIDLENAAPIWAEYECEGTWTNNFFNWAWANEEANHMPFVREAENMGLGGQNPGHYRRSEEFVGIVRCGAEDEASLAEVTGALPNFNTDFHHVVIQ